MTVGWTRDGQTGKEIVALTMHSRNKEQDEEKFHADSLQIQTKRVMFIVRLTKVDHCSCSSSLSLSISESEELKICPSTSLVCPVDFFLFPLARPYVHQFDIVSILQTRTTATTLSTSYARGERERERWRTKEDRWIQQWPKVKSSIRKLPNKAIKNDSLLIEHRCKVMNRVEISKRQWILWEYWTRARRIAVYLMHSCRSNFRLSNVNSTDGWMVQPSR